MPSLKIVNSMADVYIYFITNDKCATPACRKKYDNGSLFKSLKRYFT